MARPRKQKYDPRQLSFTFDVTADQIEQLRRENAQADTKEEYHARQTNQSLDIARTVLRPQSIREVQSAAFTNSAYLILDRWALNQPDDLRRLEARGEISFMVTLDQQATREANVLNSDSAWEASRQGMSDWEILQNAGIDTSLKITI